MSGVWESIQPVAQWEEICCMAVSARCRPPLIQRLDRILETHSHWTQRERTELFSEDRPALRRYICYRFPEIAQELGLDGRILVAVYGTLRAKGNDTLPGYPQCAIGRIGRSVILPGRIFDIRGEYPGLVAGQGKVFAEIIELAKHEDLWQLDCYEEYLPHDPYSSEYLRRCLYIDGMDLWVYYYNFPVSREDLVPGGDWISHIFAPK